MKITLSPSEILIEFSVWEKIWALHGNFQIPRGNITAISEGNPKSSWFDLRVPGTFMPGLIKAGTFYTRRGREFWYVTHGISRIYSIELSNMSYSRLVLGTNQKID